MKIGGSQEASLESDKDYYRSSRSPPRVTPSKRSPPSSKAGKPSNPATQPASEPAEQQASKPASSKPRSHPASIQEASLKNQTSEKLSMRRLSLFFLRQQFQSECVLTCMIEASSAGEVSSKGGNL